ncbi:MAG: ABC transporter permease [Clostridia bacterium]|nr:ABC transporter permease [Clostridia bacterium]
MNKYLNIYSTSFKQESKTFANSLTSVVSFVVIIYIFQQLWQFIYGGNGGGTLINGYTIQMMIWYMIMAEVLMYSVNARGVTRAFGNDIKSGKIAYQLNKPYNYYMYQIFSQLGEIMWKLVFLVPTGIVMGLILLGPIQNFSVLYVLPLAVSLLLAVVLTAIIYGTVGLLTFWIEEATPFTWIVQKFQMLFGLFFPPEFFPTWLQPIINYSPVYAMMSGPCKLMANFSWDLFLNVSISQIVYIAAFISIGLLIYKLGTKKVNVNGG